jgi:hypothetical protein
MNQFNIIINRRNLFIVPQSLLAFHVYDGDRLVLDLSAMETNKGYEWISNQESDDERLKPLVIQSIERYLNKAT